MLRRLLHWVGNSPNTTFNTEEIVLFWNSRTTALAIHRKLLSPRDLAPQVPPSLWEGSAKTGKETFFVALSPLRDNLTHRVIRLCCYFLQRSDLDARLEENQTGLTVVQETDDVSSQCARGLRRGVLNDTTQVSPAGTTGQHLVAWHWFLSVQGQSRSRKFFCIARSSLCVCSTVFPTHEKLLVLALLFRETGRRSVGIAPLAEFLG